MKQVLLFFAFCICSGLILGQSPDTAAIYTLADTALANKLLAEGTELNNSRKLEEAFEKLTKAGDIYKKVLGEDVVEYASVLFQLGRNRYFLYEYNEAVSLYEKALAIQIKKLNSKSLEIARTYNNLALVYFDTGNYIKAEYFFGEVLNIRKQALGMEHIDVAVTLNNLGNIYRHLVKYKESIACHQAALSIRLKAFSLYSQPVAQSHSNLGNTYMEMEDYNACENHYKIALDIRTAILPENHNDLAESYNNIGVLYDRTEEYKKAIYYYKKSLGVYKKIHGVGSWYLIDSYNNIGVSYTNMGDYDKAREFYEKALSIAINKNSFENRNDVLIRIYNNLGLTYDDLKDYEKAIIYFNEGIKLWKENHDEDDISLAILYTNKAVSLWHQGSHEKSIAYNDASLKIYKDLLGDNNYEVARYFINMGAIFYDMNKLDTAIQFYKNGLNIFLRLSPQSDIAVATCYRNIGNTYSKKGDLASASNYYNSGLQTMHYQPGDLSQVNYPNDCVVLLKGLTNLYLPIITRSRPHLDTAYDYAQQALAALRYQQQSLSTDGSKAQLLENHYPVYEGAIQTSLMVADLDNNDSLRRAAFDHAEQSKAAILRAKIKEGEALRFAGIPDSLLQQEYDLRVGIAWREKQRQEKLNAGQSETDSTILAISGRLFDLRQQYDSLKARFEREHRDYYRAKYDLRTVSVADVQRSIHPGQTLLEYFVGDSSIFIFLIQPDFFDVKKVAIDASFQQRVLDMTQNGIYGYYASPKSKRSVRLKEKTTRAYATAAAELYQLLIEPFKSKLTTELIIIPDGRLGYIPFEALLTSQPTDPLDFSTYDFLLKRYQISYDYSATLFREMSDKQHRQPPANEVLAMAPFSPDENQYISHIDTTDYSPDFALRDTLAALPGSGEELNAIMKYFKGLPLLGNTATIDTFLRLASRYRILHLSTHAEADDRAGDYAYLAFSMPDNNGEFAKLYARDLYNLSLNADMVVLSACETGVGKLQRGEGIVSLARAFAFAGAKSIFTTLWKVSDEKTKDLVGAFYKYLRKEKAKDEALRLAKLEYLKKNEKTPEFLHPFFWAGMIGIGDMRPMDW